MGLSNKWLTVWNDKEYIELKKNNFSILENYIKTPPKNILDIGCGLAFESEQFQKKYNSDLWLLDSDFENTEDRSRDILYGKADTFKFYSNVNDLKSSYDQRNMSYTFVDANDINIDSNIKFDLIYSILSCGFHYPAVTYKKLIQQHSHKNTVVLMDIRKKLLHQQENDFKLINVVHNAKKHLTCQIQF